MTEKSEFRVMRSFDLAIRRAYFKAQIHRNYAKTVVINRSAVEKHARPPRVVYCAVLHTLQKSLDRFEIYIIIYLYSTLSYFY